MREQQNKKRRLTFGIRSLLLAVAIAALLTLLMISWNGSTETTSELSIQSPDKQTTLVIKTRVHKPLTRHYESTSIVAMVYAADGKVSFYRSHTIDPSTTASLIPADYSELEPANIDWSSDSKTVTYPVTDLESVTIEIETGRTSLHETIRGR